MERDFPHPPPPHHHHLFGAFLTHTHIHSFGIQPSCPCRVSFSGPVQNVRWFCSTNHSREIKFKGIIAFCSLTEHQICTVSEGEHGQAARRAPLHCLLLLLQEECVPARPCRSVSPLTRRPHTSRKQLFTPRAHAPEYLLGAVKSAER